MARPRFPSGKTPMTMAVDAGCMSPAAMPWIARAAMIEVALVANAQAIEPPANSSKAIRNTPSRPNRSARRPPMARVEARARRNAFGIHAAVAVVSSSCACMVGSATPTTVASRKIIESEPVIAMSVRPGCVGTWSVMS